MCVEGRGVITKREFEVAYAKRSKVSVRSLRKWRRVYPCNCGESECEGWKCVNPVLYWDDRGYREPRWWKRTLMRFALAFWRLRMGS